MAKRGGGSAAQANFLTKKSLDMCSGRGGQRDSSKVVFVKKKFVLRLPEELLSTFYLLQNIQYSTGSQTDRLFHFDSRYLCYSLTLDTSVTLACDE